jgi:hypothetical protein
MMVVVTVELNIRRWEDFVRDTTRWVDAMIVGLAVDVVDSRGLSGHVERVMIKIDVSRTRIRGVSRCVMNGKWRMVMS